MAFLTPLQPFKLFRYQNCASEPYVSQYFESLLHVRFNKSEKVVDINRLVLQHVRIVPVADDL